jgi:hypothetical protein
MGWLSRWPSALPGRRVVLVSLIPVALGHAAAIAVVVYAVVGLGMAIDEGTFPSCRARCLSAGARIISSAGTATACIST